MAENSEKRITEKEWKEIDVDIIAWNIEELHLVLKDDLMGKIQLFNCMVGLDKFDRVFLYSELYQIEISQRCILKISCLNPIERKLIEVTLDDLKDYETML